MPYTINAVIPDAVRCMMPDTVAMVADMNRVKVKSSCPYTDHITARARKTVIIIAKLT